MGRVQLKDVSKRYEDVIAVNEMNLDIEDGEFVTLVGPSGCGKSTTLETIAGLTIPTEGEIRIAEREVTNLPPKDRGIAMVFQNIALFPHMDVYDNISFGLRLRSFDKEEIDRRVNRAAEILQIGNLLERKPSELSGGQRQRVAIGRAIVREPEAFLMDEPLANLDAKLRVHMRTELQRLHDELETTIIYVTHDQAEAMTMSDRIAILNAGELQQIAPPLTTYNEPTNLFVAGFIGSPSMNFVDVLVEDGRLVTETFSVELEPDQYSHFEEGDELVLGIRPEDVYLEKNVPELTHPSDLIEARTDVLEPMGNELFVYLILDEGEGFQRDLDELEEETGTVEVTNSALLMSVDPDEPVERDQTLRVALDRSKVHLFDAETGDAITHGIGEPAAVEMD